MPDLQQDSNLYEEPENYEEKYNQFFEPLSGQTGDYLAFPGFGFWTRNYAEFVANITVDMPDIVSNPQIFCENIITMIYYHQEGQNPLQNNGSEAVLSPNCAPFWDKVSCFPATEAGEQSVIPCPEYILGTAYDTSANATRECSLDGVWADKAVYDHCKPKQDLTDTTCDNSSNPSYLCMDYSMMIYSIGYTLSLASLIIALIILLSLREVRCLRNKIHANLFFSYILSISCWIVTALNHKNYASENGLTRWSCVILPHLVRYFHLSTFFWMFIEGFYLFLQVHFTSLHSQNVKLRHYLCIGWGLPLLVVGLWSFLTYYLPDPYLQPPSASAIPYSMDDSYYKKDDGTTGLWNSSTENIELVSNSYTAEQAELFALEEDIEELPISENQTVSNSCPFMEHTHSGSEWAYNAPVLLILACNMLILIYIMTVVICKLRSETTERHRQHWRAAKALLVIFPLLGITYIITLVGPQDQNRVFKYVRIILLSLQGFVITLPYCFLNTEIRSTIKQHWERWRLNRGSDPYIEGHHRRASNRNSFSMAGFYSTETTATRLSSHPQGVGTPERIPLQNMSHLCSHDGSHNNHHSGSITNGTSTNGTTNGNNGSSNEPIRPSSSILQRPKLPYQYRNGNSVGHSSAIGSGVTFNGASFNEQTNGSSPRTVFVTIHENEVTTKLISNHGSPTSISNLDNLDSIKQTLVTTEIN